MKWNEKMQPRHWQDDTMHGVKYKGHWYCLVIYAVGYKTVNQKFWWSSYLEKGSSAMDWACSKQSFQYQDKVFSHQDYVFKHWKCPSKGNKAEKYSLSKLSPLKVLKGLMKHSFGLPSLAVFTTFCIHAGNCIVVCELCLSRFQVFVLQVSLAAQ